MSTRANIKVVDDTDTLWFYRHSDGYPNGAMPVLQKFLDMVKSGKIRDNASQASGWLIVLGAKELYGTIKHIGGNAKDLYSWKVGSIEPTTGQHGDIEWLYTIDLVNKKIITKEI